MTNKAKGRRGLIQRITRKSARGGLVTKKQEAGIRNAWTAVHAPRVTYAGDRAPERSWWAETPPERFSEVAREEFAKRMRHSGRQVGQRGIDG